MQDYCDAMRQPQKCDLLRVVDYHRFIIIIIYSLRLRVRITVLKIKEEEVSAQAEGMFIFFYTVGQCITDELENFIPQVFFFQRYFKIHSLKRLKIIIKF